MFLQRIRKKYELDRRNKLCQPRREKELFERCEPKILSGEGTKRRLVKLIRKSLRKGLRRSRRTEDLQPYRILNYRRYKYT